MDSGRGFTLIELLIVIAIIGLLAVMAIPLLLNAMDRARQAMSVERVLKMGRYTEQYILDHSMVGCPKVGTDVDALQQLFEENEIDFNKFLVWDGWHNKIVIDMDATQVSRRYTIMSYGSDGDAGPDPLTEGVVKRFIEDIIWSNGTFLQRPEGLQTSE